MQEEVDYTRFYYNKKGEPVLSQPISVEDDIEEGREDHRGLKPRKARKKGKGKKLFFGFTVLLLCFGLVFFLADFFGKGFLTDVIGRAFSGQTYEYYFVASPASSRYVAYADSLNVKQKGGGGYIIGEEEWWVAYAVYTDRTSASQVSIKNAATEIYTVKFASKDDLAKSVDTLIKELELTIEKWEKGTIGEAEISAVLLSKKEDFGCLKETYSDNKLGLIELICDGLDDFSLSKTEKITGLSSMRYFLCCVAYSAHTVFS